MALSQIVTHLIPKGVKRRMKRLVLRSHTCPVELLSADPWSSPNVWQDVVATYAKKESPSIFEFGCGASSIHHIRNLLGKGQGFYTAVEHDRSWYALVCGTIVRLCMTEGLQFSALRRDIQEVGADFELTTAPAKGQECRIVLKHREPQDGYSSGEGSGEQFDHYIKALGPGQYDLIVVDGRARKYCVNYVLDKGYLIDGGSLALFEAGRGAPDWLGKATSTGDEDYQPVVQKMVERGARLIDGVGYLSWPSHEVALTRKKNPPIPLECCLLTVESVGSVSARRCESSLSHDKLANSVDSFGRKNTCAGVSMS